MAGVTYVTFDSIFLLSKKWPLFGTMAANGKNTLFSIKFRNFSSLPASLIMQPSTKSAPVLNAETYKMTKFDFFISTKVVTPEKLIIILSILGYVL